MKAEAFHGIRMMEFGGFIAGPSAGMILSCFGAEVIKVEHPTRFDGARYFTTGIVARPPDPRYGDQFFDVSNINKKSVVVDFSKPAGRQIVLDLAATCDVFLENMTPGALQKNGLAYEDVKAVNRRIVYISSSSCGQTGPERHYRGYAGHFAAKAGLGHITGYPDSSPALFTGSVDFRSATNTTLAILLGLMYRLQTGKGQFVDVSSQEAIAAQMGDVYLDYILNGEIPTRQGNKRPSHCPNNLYRTIGEDDWVAISCFGDEEFAGLCRAIDQDGLASDPRFSTHDARKRNEDELDGILTQWTKDKTKHQAAALLQKAGVAAEPCLTGKEVHEDRNNLLRESFKSIEHPLLGRDYIVNTPWRYASETPSAIKRHAPRLGEDTVRYLRELGRTEEQIRRLEEDRVILV